MVGDTVRPDRAVSQYVISECLVVSDFFIIDGGLKERRV